MKNNPLDNLPHTYPFRFVDKILGLSAEKGVAIKNVTVNEAFFQGHFNGNSLMPGVLIIEAMAQLAGLVMNYDKTKNKIVYLAQIKDIKFRRPVIPGDQIRIVAEINQNFLALASFFVTAFVDNEVVVEGELVMLIKEGSDE